MSAVVGVDASTKSFGVALGDGTLFTIRPRAGADDPGRRLHELVSAFGRGISLRPPKPLLAVVEGPADHSPGIRSTIALAKVRGAIELRCFELDVAYVEIPPKRLKKWATGNGNAPKELMVDAARADGADPANDDEADAYFLRQIGRVALGLEAADRGYDVTLRKTRFEIVAAYRWPTVTPPGPGPVVPSPTRPRRRSHDPRSLA